MTKCNCKLEKVGKWLAKGKGEGHKVWDALLFPMQMEEEGLHFLTS